MLFTLSSKLCTVNDQLRKPNKFSNHLAFPIVINRHEGPDYYVKLEGIDIDPWPTEAVLINVSLCERQLCGKKTLSMVYEKGKFSQPKVPATQGETQDIVIEVNTVDDSAVKFKYVTLQLSVLPM